MKKKKDVNVKLVKMELENVQIKNHVVMHGMYYVKLALLDARVQIVERMIVECLTLDAKLESGGKNMELSL